MHFTGRDLPHLLGDQRGAPASHNCRKCRSSTGASTCTPDLVATLQHEPCLGSALWVPLMTIGTTGTTGCQGEFERAG